MSGIRLEISVVADDQHFGLCQAIARCIAPPLCGMVIV
jgi:hypothetical protein